jgi:hypothetical protein
LEIEPISIWNLSDVGTGTRRKKGVKICFAPFFANNSEKAENVERK